MYLKPLKYFPPPPSTRPPEIWGARFPPEIFETVMVFLPSCVQPESELPKTLYACCLTCRDWLSMSRVLLYANVALTDRIRFEQFVRTVRSGGGNGSGNGDDDRSGGRSGGVELGIYVKSLLVDCTPPLKRTSDPASDYLKSGKPPVDEETFISQNREAQYSHWISKPRAYGWFTPEGPIKRTEWPGVQPPLLPPYEQAWVNLVPMQLPHRLKNLASLELRSVDLTKINSSSKFYQHFKLFKTLEILKLVDVKFAHPGQLFRFATAVQKVKAELHLTCHISPPEMARSPEVQPWGPLPCLKFHLPVALMPKALNLAMPSAARGLTTLSVSLPKHHEEQAGSWMKDLKKTLEALQVVLDSSGSSLTSLSLVFNWVPVGMLRGIVDLKPHSKLNYLSLSVLVVSVNDAIVDINNTTEVLKTISSKDVQTLKLYLHTPDLSIDSFSSGLPWESLDNELSSTKYAQLRNAVVETYSPAGNFVLRLAEVNMRRFLPNFTARSEGRVWPEKSTLPEYYRIVDVLSKYEYSSQERVLPKKGRAPKRPSRSWEQTPPLPLPFR